MALLLAALAAPVLLAGCAVGGPEVSASARCDGPAFTSEEMPSGASRTLILVELSRNDEEAREAVAQAIDPTVQSAVAAGGVVRLLVNGGEGEPVEESPCLDGTTTIMVDRHNEETERRARETAVNAIEGSVSALLAETEIAARGALSNLLAQGIDGLHTLGAVEGEASHAPASVLIVSDLTSPAAHGDCLSLDGVRASQAVADAMVARCLATGQLQRLPEGTELRIVRPQLSPGDNATARMGGFLRKSLCLQLADERGGCASSPAGRE